MYDLLIKNGMIVDGSGALPFRGDLAVKDGKIARIAKMIEEEAAEVLDAAGLIVSPGFIDAHSHDDIMVLSGDDAPSILEQGITTEVGGQCGGSLTPFLPETAEELGVDSNAKMFAGLVAGGGNLAALLKELEHTELPVNIAFLIGHGSIRQAVMGLENRPATPEELNAMKDLLRQELEAGAIGFSTGLIYPPCCYAGPKELVELAKAAAEYPDALYASHMRNESYQVVAAVQETIELGARSGLPVHISHHKIAGKGNEGTSRITLVLISSARAQGQDVTLDAYPYDGGATALINALPPKYRVVGNEALLEQLKDPSFRAQVKAEMEVVPTDFENLIGMCGFDRVLLENADAEGVVSLADLAKAQGKEPFDALFDLIIETKGNAGGIYRMIIEEDMNNILRYPVCSVGIDACREPLNPNMHPRSRASYPRFLARWVREKSWLTLEDGVRKITGLPADSYGLHRKGYLREGLDADLVIFDYATIAGPADYGCGDLPNIGIKAVYVNGTCAVWDGVITGKNAGRPVLRAETVE
ncbi:MAG: D-aminoacylase [Firmicutes bacterium]|nr:D-aminoacylase [Bacillota bacterium]